ncbi:MAG: arginine--tRNA ligase, partial [Clostridia bacterium]|nr:arginine--tRNA ligase [Clostridia bacterium]
MINIEETVRSLTERALRKVAAERGRNLPDALPIMLERPRREGQGDWACNVAMQVAKVMGT